MANEDLEIRLRGRGEHYGYPKCCIEWFVEKRWKVGEELNDDQFKVEISCGFLPCPDCARRVLDEGLELKDLIQDRDCPREIDEPGYCTCEYEFKPQLPVIQD